MRALVLSGPEQMELRTVPEPDLAPGDLRVAVDLAGICGTDVRLFRGTKVIAYPRIIGHEFTGRIAEVTAEAGPWPVGERVVVYPTMTCGECYACLGGRPNICVHRRTIGYEIDGGFAEQVVVPAQAVRDGHVIRVPGPVSDRAAGTSEPAAAALQGVRRARVAEGSEVLIFGGGPIGLAHVQLCRLAGASTVALSEPQPERRAVAMQLGADAAFDAGADPTSWSRGVFGEPGPDIAFIDVGVPALVPMALSLLRKGGRCVLFAGMPEGSTCLLEPNVVHYREVDLIGSSSSTPGLHAEVLSMAAAGELRLEALVSDVLPLERWADGFSMKQHAAGLKVLLATGSG